MLLVVAQALAQDPTETVDPSGIVTVACTVAAPEATVREALSDPVAVAYWSGQTLSAVATPSGPCAKLGMKVSGAFSPIHLDVLSCPTRTGWKLSLLESDTVTSFGAEWTVQAVDASHTRVSYAVHSDVNLPVPDSLVRKNVLAGAKQALQALIEKVRR